MTDQYSGPLELRRTADLLRHYRTVRSYLTHFSRPWCTADDLLQETYAQAYQTVRNRGPPEKPLSWLRAIATRTAYRVLRHERQHRGEVLEDVLDKHTRQPLDELITQEQLALLSGALRNLSDADQKLLDGYYVRDMSCRELGHAYGFSRDAVKTRLHRARERLKKHLLHANNDSGSDPP